MSNEPADPAAVGEPAHGCDDHAAAPVPLPRPVSAADLAAFENLVKQSLPSVRAMAAAWRTGLAALVTLVITGILVAGRSSVSAVAWPWRIAVTLAIGGGVALALAGLWNALGAEVGSRGRLQTLDQIRARHASVEAYLVAQAMAATRRLERSRILVGFALGLLLIGVLLTWWAPAR